MGYMEATASEREIENCRLRVGDVVITKDSETPSDIGVPAVVREKIADLVCGYHLAILRPKKSVLDGEYLHYALGAKHVKRQFQMYANGITRFGLRAGDIQRISILLPPLLVQCKIACILSSIDDAIEKTQAVIDQVQVVKRGLMQELLTRGLPGWHTRFKQTEIGEIPECWQLAVLDEVLDGIEAGWSPKCEGRPADANEWGVLKVSSISSGRFKQHENKALQEGLVEPRPQVEVMCGDVLVSRASGILELVGRSAFVHQTRRKLMLSDKTLRVRAKESVLRPLFLNLLLTDPKNSSPSSPTNDRQSYEKYLSESTPTSSGSGTVFIGTRTHWESGTSHQCSFGKGDGIPETDVRSEIRAQVGPSHRRAPHRRDRDCWSQEASRINLTAHRVAFWRTGIPARIVEPR